MESSVRVNDLETRMRALRANGDQRSAMTLTNHIFQVNNDRSKNCNQPEVRAGK